jgi:hypothetical protein
MLYKKEKNFFLLHRESLLTTLVALACLGLFTFFPASGALQMITSGLIFFCVIPLLYLKFILHKDLHDFGFQVGDRKVGITFSLLYLASAFLICLLLFHYTAFAKGYYLPKAVSGNFGYFVFYELVLSGIFVALYEIFFRGFAMFSLAAKTGFYAIFYQFLLIFLFLWSTENLNWNSVPVLITAAFSGLTTYKSRSLIYSFVSSLFFLIILDTLAIKFAH